MFFSRRHVFLTGGGKTVLVKNLADPDGANPYTLPTGFTAKAGQVLTLFVDFTFSGNHGDGSTSAINNILCAGIAPQSWNDTCCRLYTGNGDAAQLLVVGFDNGGQQYLSAGGSLIRRNKAVLRIHYGTGTMDVWLNGRQIAQGFGAFGDGGQSACLGAVSISNAEGNNRFWGTYHEISRLSGIFTDAQLLAFTQ